MKIDRTKFTAHYENGVLKSMWVGLEHALDDGDSPQAAFDQAKKISDEWHAKNNPHFNSIGDLSSSDASHQTLLSKQLDSEYDSAVATVSAFEFEEDALKWMNNNGWTFNIEMKNIANSKPKKQ